MKASNFNIRCFVSIFETKAKFKVIERRIIADATEFLVKYGYPLFY